MPVIAGGRPRVDTALAHQTPGRVPVDFGSTSVRGIHVSRVSALRRNYGLSAEPVKVIDPGAILGEIGDELQRAMGIDTIGIRPRNIRCGFSGGGLEEWRLYDGTEVLVPAGVDVMIDTNADGLIHPQDDRSARPHARMPPCGYFFEAMVRPQPCEEEGLRPEENLEE
jgi:hypothetical protein